MRFSALVAPAAVALMSFVLNAVYVRSVWNAFAVSILISAPAVQAADVIATTVVANWVAAVNALTAESVCAHAVGVMS